MVDLDDYKPSPAVIMNLRFDYISVSILGNPAFRIVQSRTEIEGLVVLGHRRQTWTVAV